MHTLPVLDAQSIHHSCSTVALFRPRVLSSVGQTAHPLTQHSRPLPSHKHHRGHRHRYRNSHLAVCRGVPEDADDAQHDNQKPEQAEQPSTEGSENGDSETSERKDWRRETVKRLQGGGDPPPKRTLQEEVYRFTANLVRNVAFPGTVAVTAAWFLKLDAFGNFHWDYGDVAHALLTISPFCFLLISVMLGDWESQLPEASPLSGLLTRSLNGEEAVVMAVPRRAVDENENIDDDESHSGAAADTQEAGREAGQHAGLVHRAASSASTAAVLQALASVAGDSPAADGQQQPADKQWPPQQTPLQSLYGALHAYQKTLVLGPSQPVTAASMFLQLATRFADEMAIRAVLLTALGGWCADRLFEAGLEPTVNILGRDLGTEDAGKAVAVSIFCGYIFGLTLNSLRQSSRLEKLGREMMEGKDFGPELAEAAAAEAASEDEKAARIRALLPKPDADKAAAVAEAAKRQQGKEKRAEALWGRHQAEMGRAMRLQAGSQASSLLVGSLLSTTKLATLCYLYIATGNMAASFAASCAVSGIGIACKQVRRGQLLQRQRDRLEDLVSTAKSGALQRLKEQRRNRKAAAAAISSTSGSHDSEEVSVDETGEAGDGSDRQDE